MPETTTVKKGDSWARLAKEIYGDERMMGELMRANKGVLTLRPGQKVVLPNQVDNPFVSFAQATQGSAYNEQKFAETQQYISTLKGGAEWQAQAGITAGTAAGTTTPTTQVPTFGATRGALPPGMPASYSRLATMQPNTGLTPPAIRAAQENPPGPKDMQYWQRATQVPITGKPVTGTARGAVSPQPLVAGPAQTNQDWRTTPMNQTKLGKAVLNLPGQVAGAVKGFAGQISAGAQQSVQKTVEQGQYNRNATPFERFVAGQARTPQQTTAPQAAQQPVQQAVPQAVPQKTTPTGANNISSQLPANDITRSYEAHQAATFIFEMDETVLEQQYKYGLSHQAAVDAYTLSGFPDPALAERQATADLIRAGWTRSGSEWLPPSAGQGETPFMVNSSQMNLTRLNWQNMDIATLTQLGFYDAPSQPTFGPTGRGTGGGASPAPVTEVTPAAAASWLRGSGQSWQMRP